MCASLINTNTYILYIDRYFKSNLNIPIFIKLASFTLSQPKSEPQEKGWKEKIGYGGQFNYYK